MSACARPHQAYSGPPRPDAEIVRFRAEGGRFRLFDGSPLFAGEIEALPGTHDVEVTYVLTGDELGPNVRDEDRGRLVCQGRIDSVAGESYRIRVGPHRPAGRRGGIVDRYSLGLEMVEERTSRRIMARFACGWE